MSTEPKSISLEPRADSKSERTVKFLRGVPQDWVALGGDEHSEHSDGEDDNENDFDMSDEDAGYEDGKITHKREFHVTVGILIFLNVVFISLEASLIQEESFKTFFHTIEMAFTVFYLLELTLRLKEENTHKFFCGKHRLWNWYDFSVTLAGVLDIVSSATGTEGTGKVGGTARIFRIMRIMRLFRAFKFVTDIDFVIVAAAAATFKLAVVVILLLLVSAIVTTDLLWDAQDSHVKNMFANLGASMWTLFKMMTLEDWSGTVERVDKCRPGMHFFFVLFVFIGSIALVSLVPAVFIELQMLERKKQKHHRMQEHRKKERDAHVELLHQVFDMTDTDRDGVVTISQVEDVLEELDRPQRKSPTSRARSCVVKQEELKDFRLCLFELWADKFHECGDHDVKITKQEFTKGVLSVWENTDLKLIWRGLTSSRMQMSTNANSGNKVVRRIGRYRSRTSLTNLRLDEPAEEDFNSIPSSPLQRLIRAQNTLSSAASSRSIVDQSSSSASAALRPLKVDGEGEVKLRQQDLMQALSTQGETQATIAADLRAVITKMSDLEQVLSDVAAEVRKPNAPSAMDCLSAELREERSLVENLQRLFDEHTRQVRQQMEESSRVCRTEISRLHELLTSTMEASSVRFGQSAESSILSTAAQPTSPHLFRRTSSSPKANIIRLHGASNVCVPALPSSEQQSSTTRNPFRRASSPPLRSSSPSVDRHCNSSALLFCTPLEATSSSRRQAAPLPVIARSATSQGLPDTSV